MNNSLKRQLIENMYDGTVTIVSKSWECRELDFEGVVDDIVYVFSNNCNFKFHLNEIEIVDSENRKIILK